MSTEYLNYDKHLFKQEFIQSDTYKQLVNDYQHVYESLEEFDDRFYTQPRRTYAADRSIFYYSTFYYLQLLLEKNPKTILDLGCGRNLFKKYIPQIIGLDNDPREIDSVDIYDNYSEKFLNENLEKYDCAMTIGAIHDVSLTKISNRINDFGRLIKPGGRGYFGVNLRRPLQNTAIHEFAELFDLSRPQTFKDLYCVVHRQIEKIKYKIIALDITILDAEKDRYNEIKGSDWPSWVDYLNDDFTKVNISVRDKIYEEIMSFNFGKELLLANGPSEIIDGNLKLVFEV